MASGDARLLAFLQQALQQLDQLSGEPDPLAHESLDKLATALEGASLAKEGATKKIAQPVDEAQLEGLLNNLDQQLGALEAVLADLPEGGDTSTLLAAGLSEWHGVGPADSGPDLTGAADDNQPEVTIAELPGSVEGDSQAAAEPQQQEDVSSSKATAVMSTSADFSPSQAKSNQTRP